MEINEDQSDFSSLTVYSTLEEGENLSTPLLEDGKFKNPWSLWYAWLLFCVIEKTNMLGINQQSKKA